MDSSNAKKEEDGDNYYRLVEKVVFILFLTLVDLISYAKMKTTMMAVVVVAHVDVAVVAVAVVVAVVVDLRLTDAKILH